MKTRLTPVRLALGLALLVFMAGVVWRQWPGAAAPSGSRKVLYYQDSMHPWIKSEGPGKCTICAMALTPIYEGQQGFGADLNLVVLSSNSVTVLNVQTEVVQRQVIRHTLKVAGTLEANESRKTIIAAPSPGRIQSSTVEFAGVEVEKGQQLVTLFSPELVQKRAFLRSVGGDQLGAGQGLVRTAQGSNSPYLGEILAPQSGVVVERNVYPGQYVVEGEKLFTLVDASVLWFRFDAYEQQLPWLRPGQTLEVTTASVPGQAFPAVISFIEPSLNDATRSVKVRADVLNPLERGTESPQRLLRLGAYAEAQVRTEIPAVLAVPRAAILFPGGSAYAYVERGHGAYARQRVRLGRQGDDLWEVLGGLAAGDRVVTSGNVLIDAQAQFNQPDRVEEPASDDAGAAGVPQAMAVDAGPGPAVVAQPARSASTPAPGGGLDPAQQKALRAFLVIADGVSQALAADSLAQLGTNTAALPGVASSLRKALGNDHPWRTLLERIEATARWPAPKDLAAARKTFLPFSTNVVALVELARGREPGFRTLKVFHCPMAPKPGLWFQASGPLKNPYYGDEMLTCGEEVAPAPNSGAAASHQAMAEPEQAPPAKAVAPVAEPRPAKPAPPAAAGVSAKPKPRATTPGQETNEAAAATSLEHPSAGHTRVVSAVMSQTDELKAMRREIILKARQADADAAAAAIKAGAPAPPVLTPAAQLAAARQLTLAATLELADGIGQSLAADDLSGFYQRIVGLPTVFTLLRREFDTNHPYAGLIGALITQGLPLAGAGQWRTVDSLAAARERFLPFSTAVVELARVLQHEDAAFAGLKIYHCPPAPPPGLWMQAKGPLQNPFFGVTNRSSGAEVISAAGPSGPPPAPTPSAPAGVPK